MQRKAVWNHSGCFFCICITMQRIYIKYIIVYIQLDIYRVICIQYNLLCIYWFFRLFFCKELAYTNMFYYRACMTDQELLSASDILIHFNSWSNLMDNKLNVSRTLWWANITGFHWYTIFLFLEPINVLLYVAKGTLHVRLN